MTEKEQNELLAMLANRLLNQLTLLQIIEFAKEGSIAMAHQQIADMSDEDKQKNLEMLRKDQMRMQEAMQSPPQPPKN
ncbi:MAG: hypothetical protein HOD72_07305 [Opitutae bacterium]|nr:hypothetical protein [Opitutae bacterium]MBT5379803.1 hypothetical protein [Opitutae bacterium]MBT5690136.1 hypothetical protein [Opitutae bacterium]MBT7853278.1 hypothetical protein [Opitutae bacterium]